MTKTITINDFTNKELIRAISAWLAAEKNKHEGFSVEHQMFHKIIGSLEDGSWLDYHNKRVKDNACH